MSKIRILSVVLASACVAAPVMAEDDFGALSRLPNAVAPMSEARLAAVEGGGGDSCTSSATATGGPLTLIPVAVNALNCNAISLGLGVGILGSGIGTGGPASVN